MNAPFRITRNLTFIYILSFLGDFGYSVFLVGSIFLAYQMGASPALIGLVGSAYGICYVISPTIAGKIGDKITRRSSLLIATTGQVGTTLFLIFLVRSPYDLIIGQAMMGIFCGFYWPAIEAKISEETEYSSQAHAIGMAIYCIVFSIGLALGPFISGIFADWNIRLVYVMDLSIYGIGFLVVLFGLSRDMSKKQDITQNANINSHQQNHGAKSIIFTFILGAFLFSALSHLVLVYFPDYAIIPESLDWSGTLIGTIILCFGIGRTIYFAVGSFEKMNLKKLIFTFLIGGLLVILIPFISNPYLLGVLFILIGITVGRIFLLSLNLLLVQQEKGKGAMAGIFESGTGLGGVLIPLLTGLIGELSLTLPFIVLGGVIVILFLISYVLTKNQIIKK